MQELQRLAGVTAEGVAGGRVSAREHARGAHLLGAVRACAWPFRHLRRGHAHPTGAVAPRAIGAALVRHLEERKLALRAAVDEAAAGAPPPPRRQGRPPGRFAFAARRGDARGRHPRLLRAHAPSEGRRPRAHGDPGAGRQRPGHLGQRARLLAGSAGALRGASARRADEGARQGRPGGQLDDRVRSERRRVFHAWSVARFVGQVAAAGKAGPPCRSTPTRLCATRSPSLPPEATRAVARPTTSSRSGRPRRRRSTSSLPTST